MNKYEHIYLPLEGLLEVLERKGFKFGPGTRIHVQQILECLGKKYYKEPEKLAYILAPILVKNPEQQKIFYQVFDLYIVEVKSDAERQKKKIEPPVLKTFPPKKPLPEIPFSKLTSSLIVLGILALVFFFIYNYFNPPDKIVGNRVKTVSGYVGERISFNGILDSLTNGKPVTKFTWDFGNNFKDSSNINPHFVYSTIGEKEVVLDCLVEGVDYQWTIKVDVKVNQIEDGSYYLLVFILCIIILSLITYALVRYSKGFRVRVKSQDFWNAKNPPYKIQFPDNNYVIPVFPEIYRIAKMLKRRETGSALRLDILSSLKATIAKGGFPVIKQRSNTRPSEYLFLIDLEIPDAQQVYWLKYILGLLGKEEVSLKYFYFKQDPEWCWNAQYPDGLGIYDLYQNCPHHRLIVYGDGGYWLSKLEEAQFNKKVLKDFPNWSERTLFTSIPPENWSYREQLLQEYFNIIPGYIKEPFMLSRALMISSDDFEKRRGNWASTTEQFIEFNTFDEIKDFLNSSESSQLLDWLAATTVYPHPQWEITLAIGAMLNERPDYKDILTLENLHRLTQIKWMNQGAFPEDLRRQLLVYLKEHTRIEEVVRKVVISLLKKAKDTLPNDSYAYTETIVRIIEQELQIFPVSFETQKIAKELFSQDLMPTRSGDDIVFIATSDKNVLIKEITDNMIYVEGEELEMGYEGEGSAYSEKPVHKVAVSNFSIGKYQITEGQWKAVMDDSTSYFVNDNKHPVKNVTWYEVQEFIEKLNNVTGKAFRLPTEAEWEFSAWGGVFNKNFQNYNLDDIGWYCGNSRNKTHIVGKKKPNKLGLYDMCGNVWEWCSDWYDINYYRNSPENNPQGPKTGTYRVIRGGSWGSWKRDTSNTRRNGHSPADANNFIGFRLAH